MKKLAIRIQSKPAESIIHHSFFKYKYIIHIPKLLTSFLVCKYKPENTVFFWECSHFYNLIIGRKILLNLNLLPLSKINHCLISQLATKKNNHILPKASKCVITFLSKGVFNTCRTASMLPLNYENIKLNSNVIVKVL